MTKEEMIKSNPAYPFLQSLPVDVIEPICDVMQQYADQEVESEREKAKQSIEHCTELISFQAEQLKEKDKEIHYLQLQIQDLQEQINNKSGE